MPKTDRYPFRADIRGLLVDVASRQSTISYLELKGGRAMIGRYLIRIATEEAAAGRPPLTSVVVRKDKGVPGDGFMEAMVQVGFIASSAGADERGTWERALRETHAFWRPKLGDDLNPN